MKTNSPAILVLFLFIFFDASPAHSQKDKYKFLDSSLAANSDKWKVKLHKGFGLGKPEFGPYTTSDVEKLDSAVFKRKTKDSSYSGAIISSEGWDWDFSKYETIEKAKVYRMMVSTEKDTSEMLFSIYKRSNEKNLTVFGELMSKNDEGKILYSNIRQIFPALCRHHTILYSGVFLLKIALAGQKKQLLHLAGSVLQMVILPAKTILFILNLFWQVSVRLKVSGIFSLKQVCLPTV